jgi:hypothetical protein
MDALLRHEATSPLNPALGCPQEIDIHLYNLKQDNSGYDRPNADESARSVKAREPSKLGSVRWSHRRRLEGHVGAVKFMRRG